MKSYNDRKNTKNNNKCDVVFLCYSLQSKHYECKFFEPSEGSMRRCKYCNGLLDFCENKEAQKEVMTNILTGKNNE